MNADFYLWVLCALLIIGAGIWWFLQRRTTSVPAETMASASLATTADALVVGDLDAPLLTITPLETSESETAENSCSSQLSAQLEPLLNRAPELFRIGQEMTTRTLRVVFSREVTRGLQNGSLSLSQDVAKNLMPVARDARNGRFVQIGRTITSGGVRLANVAAASWQIAAIMTAQHYLAEINERLQRIDDRLKDIQFFQKEEKRAEIRGAVRLLKQYHEAISRGILHSHELAAVYQKIEDIEERCLGVSELGRRLAEEEFQKLNSIKVKEIRDPRGTEARSGDWLKQCKETVELVYLAESCRMVACHVKSALPGDRGFIRTRIDDIRAQVQASSDHVSALRERFHEKIVRPLNPSGDFVRRSLRYRDHGSDAAQTFDRVRDEVASMARNLDMQAESARDIAQRFDQLAESGLALDVRLDQKGKVTVLSVQPA